MINCVDFDGLKVYFGSNIIIIQKSITGKYGPYEKVKFHKTKNPLVWQLLIDKGGTGNFQDFDEMLEYANRYFKMVYGI